MLVACRDNGEKISLGEQWKRNELDKWRQKEGFFCPQCGKKVILRLGNKRIWHFAHQKDSGCESEHERESEYHMSGKLQLYEWLKEQSVAAELERYIPECKQRADIAFEWNKKKYAVEFQCSPITVELLAGRTEGYINHGFTPIWIAGGNQIKRTSANCLAMSEFQFLFLRRQGRRWMFPAYCAETRQFILLQHILPISSSKALASFHPISRSEFPLLRLLEFPSVTDHSFKCWVRELNRQKSNLLHYHGRGQKNFLNELYYNRLNLLMLPPELGLPVPSSPFIQTPPLLWQTFIYLDHFHDTPLGKVISTADILKSFLHRVRRRQIQIRRLPLAEYGDFRYAIREYLELLVSLALLENVNPQYYRLASRLGIPHTMEGQLQAESAFWNTHGNRIMANS
ncbi:competence protein CoiA [Mesobacillus campisalis]|uniref:competence protein CoiA n=1 Tax=Mesobacillus campisalis TaxID=1408103 RepID=UPI00069A2D9A|nr:competence protein CoiA family protein [Mesobacillus campisalis]